MLPHDRRAPPRDHRRAARPAPGPLHHLPCRHHRGRRRRRHTREVVEHPAPSASCRSCGDDVLMVRQFRTPIGRVLLELPAGTLDRLPDGTVEDPDRARPASWVRRPATRPPAGGSWVASGRRRASPTELMHLYLATDLTPIEGYTGPDVDERLEVERLPWRDGGGHGRAGRDRGCQDHHRRCCCWSAWSRAASWLTGRRCEASLGGPGRVSQSRRSIRPRRGSR